MPRPLLIRHVKHFLRDGGTWTAETVVLASGPANVADVPTVASQVPDGIASITPLDYGSPSDLAEGGVLVVGASATGVQLAEEIHRSGRDVTVSVGEHVRLPRTYRGRDVFWWLEATGIHAERYDQVDDVVRARHLPSPQLVGTPERRSIDLNALSDHGIDLVGRLGRIDGDVAQCSGALANVATLADLKMNRLLTTFDEWVDAGGADVCDAPERFMPTRVAPRPTLEVDLRRRDIRTILWATGYRPDHSWLDLSVFDHKGRIRHDGGVVRDAPGLYLLGANVLRRRSSSFIHGAALDTEELAAHLHQHLDVTVRRERIGAAARA